MMNFPQRHKNKKSLFYFYLLILAGGIFLVGNIPPISEAFSWGATAIAAPFWREESAFVLWLEPYRVLLTSKKDLLSENGTLKERLVLLEAGSLKTSTLEAENEELKKLLGRGVGDERSLLAVVLSKPNRSAYDTLVIDVGAEVGVRVGDRVVALGEVVVGSVEAVFPSTSRVKLFSSPNKKIEVVIGKNAIPGEAEGVGGGNFEIKLPRGVSIEEGDIVSFPALNVEILGVVERIEAKPTDSIQTIRFKNPINMFELKWVEVLATSR